MAKPANITPETRSLAISFAVLALAYILINWRYFVHAFPVVALSSVNPRNYTLLPRTQGGFIIRAVLLYLAYKAAGRLSAAQRQRRQQASALSRPHGEPIIQAAAAERRQPEHKPLSDRASDTVIAGAKGSRVEACRQQGREAMSAEDRAAEEERAERQRAWLQKLQEQQDRAAAEKATAAAAAAGAAADSNDAFPSTAAVPANAAANAAAERAVATTATAAAGASGKSSAAATAAAVAAPFSAAANAFVSAAGERQETQDEAAKGTSSGTGGAAGLGRSGSGANMGLGRSRSGANMGLGRSGSGANMVSLREAQEAEERQREWLQQLSVNASLSPLQREALERERALRAEQDAAYEAALAEDRRRAEERAAEAEAAEAEAAAAAAAAAEAVKARQAEQQRLRELRERLQSELPAEPDRTDEGAVLVRVRLPDGCSHTRRFLREAPVQQIRDWLQSLDTFPLWGPDHWSLVNSYPRQVVGPDGVIQTVADVAQDARQVALFVQEL